MRQDGWQKVILGITTPEEVMKVTSSEEYDLMERSGAEVVLTQGYPQETSSQSGKIENRVYSRLNSRVNLRYNIFSSEEEIEKKKLTPEQLSVTKDISAGGLVFISAIPINVGLFLDVIIELPDQGEPIECLAKVVRLEESAKDHTFNVAICFLDMTGAQRVRLDKYVEKENR